MAFSQKPHGALGLPRRFYLRDGLIAQCVAAAAEMNRRGWVLKVEDAYRTPQMQQENTEIPTYSGMEGKGILHK